MSLRMQWDDVFWAIVLELRSVYWSVDYEITLDAWMLVVERLKKGHAKSHYDLSYM